MKLGGVWSKNIFCGNVAPGRKPNLVVSVEPTSHPPTFNIGHITKKNLIRYQLYVKLYVFFEPYHNSRSLKYLDQLLSRNNSYIITVSMGSQAWTSSWRGGWTGTWWRSSHSNPWARSKSLTLMEAKNLTEPWKYFLKHPTDEMEVIVISARFLVVWQWF